MEQEHQNDVVDISDEGSENFDNYGVFQSDYEFKFVQEGTDKTTLMLPPVTYDSMEVQYFNIEIEVDSELHVSSLEKEETKNGTTRVFFRIAKQCINMDSPINDDVAFEPLGEDGYQYDKLSDRAAESANKVNQGKSKTDMDSHNYSIPKVVMASTLKVNIDDIKKKVSTMSKLHTEALDGTQIDVDDDLIEDDDEDDDGDDDGDDDMDDFDEIEICEKTSEAVGNESMERKGFTQARKKRGTKMKVGRTPDSQRRKYDKTSHYSRDSENFTMERNAAGTRVFKCQTCNYTSKWPGNMRDHVRTHTGERPFKCFVCEKAFSNQTGYNKHLTIHSDERPHVCKICGFSFKQPRQLVKHTRRHVMPGPIQCKICGKDYYSKSELLIHMPTHTGEKNHVCQECGKSFTSVSSLGRHKMLHTGAKFECHICGQTASRKEYWRAHMIKVHQFDENNVLLAKRAKFTRLFDRESSVSSPGFHQFKVVKAELSSAPEAAIQETQITLESSETPRSLVIAPGSSDAPETLMIASGSSETTGSVVITPRSSETCRSLRIVPGSPETPGSLKVEIEEESLVLETVEEEAVKTEQVQYIISLDY